jgi:hypothetical protein
MQDMLYQLINIENYTYGLLHTYTYSIDNDDTMIMINDNVNLYIYSNAKIIFNIWSSP